jgi:hypothetical protein
MERLSRRYMAGLLDGEGYFGIMNNKYENGRKHYTPTIKMASTFTEIIKEICMEFGGHIHIAKIDHPIWKDSLQWSCRTFIQVEKVLDYVHPYLIIKKQQADILKKFLQTKGDWGGAGVPEEIEKKRDNLYHLLRVINHRGKPAAETKRDAPEKGDVIVRPFEQSEEFVRNGRPLILN